MRSLRIIGLGGNSFQIFESKGAFCKIFRNKDLDSKRPPKILWGSLRGTSAFDGHSSKLPQSTSTIAALRSGSQRLLRKNGLRRLADFPIWECLVSYRSARQAQHG